MSIMDYQSTRGSAPRISPLDAVLAGIAPDGGLYISDALQQLDFDWRSCLKQDAFSMASMILGALLPDYEHMDALVEKAYRGKFETDDLTPLVQVGDKWSLELYRGPTSAFKDVALSMLPQLITAGRRQKKSDGENVFENPFSHALSASFWLGRGGVRVFGVFRGWIHCRGPFLAVFAFLCGLGGGRVWGPHHL